MKPKRPVALLCLFLILYGLVDINLIFSPAAAAAGEVTEEYEISYDEAAATKGWQGFYSAKEQLSPEVDIPAVPAKKIKSAILLRDGEVYGTALFEAEGKAAWSDKVITTGKVNKVISKENSNTNNYFAWYRYSTSNADKRWVADHEDLQGNPDKLYCGNSVTESINGADMPKFPGCPADIFFDAKRQNHYQMGEDGEGQVIDSKLVKATNVVSVKIISKQTVEGPEGTKGDSEAENGFNPITKAEVHILNNDPDTFRFQYTQAFNTYPYGQEPPSPAYKELGAPGARLMVYFGSFSFDVEGVTYKHPDKVRVVYEDNITEDPDLGSIKIKGPTDCLEPGSSGFFSVTFANNGSADIKKTFIARVKSGGNVITSKDFDGLKAGSIGTFTFSIVFDKVGPVTLTVELDPGRVISEEKNTSDNTASTTVTIQEREGCKPNVGPEAVEGDFNIDKPVISYGQDNTMYPIGVSVTGEKNGAACKLVEFGFTFRQGSITRSFISKTSSASTQGFNGPNYPGGMGEGFVDVTMTIVSSCGTTKTVGPKSFQITVPENNKPPIGYPGWFRYGNTNNYPTIDEVVVGSYVDLGIIKDKFADPQLPYDPDGDDFYPTWDFLGSTDPWIKSLGSPEGYEFWENDERFTRIKADVLGLHTVRMKLTDTRGASSSWRSATINVVKANPIAVCEAPEVVKSNRPLEEGAINANKSRSPTGSPIDHSRDEWDNKRPFYTNLTMEDTVETVTLLKVYDTSGLASENTSSCNITVQPDYPPIAKIIAPALGLRAESYDILNESYSPDGDTITKINWYMRYDANHDGVFDGHSEPWTEVSGDDKKYVFTPAKVGHYKFKVRVEEEYGAWAEAESGIMDVINAAPEVSFQLAGSNPNPNADLPTPYKAPQILSTWQSLWTNSNTHTGRLPTYSWQIENGGLLSGAGKGREASVLGKNQVSSPSGSQGTPYSTPLNDNGFGKNGLSFYKAFTHPVSGFSQPLYIPNENGELGELVYAPTSITTDKTHLYFMYRGKFWALNKNKIGRYESKHVLNSNNTGTDQVNRWLDGNPYDYSLDFYKDIRPVVPVRKHQVPYYHSGRYISQTEESETISPINQNGDDGFHFAEKTVYAVFVKNVPYALRREEVDTDDYENILDSYSNTMGCAFKASDGSLTKCFTILEGAPGIYMDPRNISILTKGDHLQLLTRPHAYTKEFTSLIEVNSEGTVIKIKPLQNYPKTEVTYNMPRQGSATCKYVPLDGPYKDMYGNWYFYEERQCQLPDGTTITGHRDYNYREYPELALGIHVAKYDSEFNLIWRTRTSGNSMKAEAQWDQKDLISTMVVNPLNNTIISKTLRVTQPFTEVYNIVNDSIDMTTGSILPWESPLLQGMTFDMHVDGYGNFSWGQTTTNIYNQQVDSKAGKDQRLRFSSSGPYANGLDTNSARGFQELVGDGILLSTWGVYQWVAGPNAPGSIAYGDAIYWIDKGPVAEATPLQPRYSYGQMLSDTTLDDAEISFTFKTEQVKIDGNRFGFTFRAADGMNRYALEFDGSSVFLAKYINGMRIELRSIPYNIQDSKAYSVKIRTVGSEMNVWLNKVNYFSDVVDESFPVSGKFGPFTDKSFVLFNAIMTKPYSETDVKSSSYAILNEDSGVAELLSYEDIVFDDPENDPIAGSFSWQYTHTPMFLNNGGVSPLSGQSFVTGLPTFDRVGLWNVTLKAKDDPYPEARYQYPDLTFDEYRKSSNTFSKSITVHRRPVSLFEVIANSQNELTWKDQSYDPDRFDLASGRVDNGYAGNRGIFERRYSYIDPDGITGDTQLTKLNKSGVWTLGLQVKDEFGAWSYTTYITLEVTVNPHRPKVTLLYPAGTKENPNYLPLNTNPQLSWKQTDEDPNTVFTAYQVLLGMEKPGYGWEMAYFERTISREFYTAEEMYSYLESEIWGEEKVAWTVKVRVRDDTFLWSDWSNAGYLSSNSPPTVTLTDPIGTLESPTFTSELRPVIGWDQNDTGSGRISRQQAKVVKVDGTLFTSLDRIVSGTEQTLTTDSWKLDKDILGGEKLKVTVRVMNPQNVWADWSNEGWMILNRPPSASMIYPGGTQDSPTLVRDRKPVFTWSQTDPDAGTIFTYFQIQVTNEANTAVILSSGEHWQNTSLTTGSYTAPADLPTGQKMRVRVKVLDGHVWSDWSPQTWFYINSPPVADFDWLPKPVWEGDKVTITSSSTDPDGDSLAYEWTVTGPDGQIRTGAEANWSGLFDAPGVYRVKLRVTDGYEWDEVEKEVEALPLTIAAEVLHTPLWLEHHQKQGHETVTAPKDFYSGEKLLLELTSSPAPVLTAEAWLEAKGLDGGSIQLETVLYTAGEEPYQFKGELYDQVLSSLTKRLPNGEHVVHFRLTYANGKVRLQDVPIRIIGAAQQAVQVHRVQ